MCCRLSSFVVLCSLSVGYLVELYVFGELGGLKKSLPDFFEIHLFFGIPFFRYFCDFSSILAPILAPFWHHFGIIFASLFQASFWHRFFCFFLVFWSSPIAEMLLFPKEKQ